MTSTPAEPATFTRIGVIGLGTMGAGIAEVLRPQRLRRDRRRDQRRGARARPPAPRALDRPGGRARQAHRGRAGRAAGPDHLHHQHEGPRRRRLRGRGGRRVARDQEGRSSASSTTIVRPGRDPRHQHLLAVGHRDLHRQQPARPRRRRALLQPRAGAEPRRGHPHRRHRARRARRRRARCSSRLGKSPVVCGDKAGFIANTLLFGYLNHAVSMYEGHYATREDIDAAMRYGCGYPMGPLALLDLIGLDTAYEILDTMYKQGRDRLHAPAPILKQMVTAGLLGRKSGRGFYTYEAPDSSKVVRRPPHPVGRRPAASCAATSARSAWSAPARWRRASSRSSPRPGTTCCTSAAPTTRSRACATTIERSLDKADPARQARGVRPRRGAGPADRHHLARGPRRRRPRRRGDRRGPARQDHAVREPRRDLQARRDPGHHDLVAADHLVRDGDQAAAGRHRHALLQPGAGHEAGRGRLHGRHRRRRRRDRPRAVREGRQGRGLVRRPGRLHRQRAAVPLPQRRGQDARGALRHRRRDRHRDEAGLRAADGSRSSCSTWSATTSRWRSSASSTWSSASPASRPRRCWSTWSPPATSAARPKRGFRDYTQR